MRGTGVAFLLGPEGGPQQISDPLLRAHLIVPLLRPRIALIPFLPSGTYRGRQVLQNTRVELSLCEIGHEVDEDALDEYAVRAGDLAPAAEEAPILVLLLSLALAACTGADRPDGCGGPRDADCALGDDQRPGHSGHYPCDNWPSTSTGSQHGQRSSGHYVLDITEWCGLA